MAFPLLLAILLPTVLDPALGFRSPIAAQAVNAALPLILMLLAWGFSGRWWVALGCEVMLLGVLRYADHVKLIYLNTGVVYADFAVIPGLLREPRLILGFIRPDAREAVGIAVVLFFAGLAAWWFRRSRPVGVRFRVGCIVLAAALLVLIGRVHIQANVPGLAWSIWNQQTGEKSVGVAGNIVLGRMAAHNVSRFADPATEQAFWREPLVQNAMQKAAADVHDRRPDIVIVQSESLFEPSMLRGFSDTPVLRRIAQEKPDAPSNLHVPVFGGRTLQTEFEVLTGTPTSFYPGSMFAYFELMGRHSIDALPRVLADQGYATTLIHPNQRGFWSRATVIPEMGFATFQDIGSFLKPQDYSDRIYYVSDMAMTNAVLAELDASNRPAFVDAISIENHGPWGESPPADESALGLPVELHGKARSELADYVQHAIAADQAYAYLLDALRASGRPTIVLIYGDHLPGLADVYRKLGFKDGKPAQEHNPPYRVWANFPIPEPPPTTSAYLLQGWLLHAAGLPLKGHELANYLAGAVAVDATVSAADKRRVLDEYANIAAANVAKPVPPRGINAGTIFIGHDHLAGVVRQLAAPDNRQATGITGDRDLFMRAVPGQPAQFDFDVGLGVASISLRPYLAPGCLATATDPLRFTVSGDGRVLYRTSLQASALRLATLDLRGTRRLVLRAEGASSQTCDGVHVRIAQLLCYAAECDSPGPSTPPATAMLPSRTLAHAQAGETKSAWP
ncbi:LTA synthase family protein [Rhodanobacter sp. DHG33]|uniref:LTA synthase family protein n=1 Tax=Rhodanobacter sp. DHG33 TaxID=2775921 RepID=UPI0017831150|nr:LTA synthase family protein [Rhodanobacter sp. DHG33]MBD8897661.1 LTA synthase family protein [Rhodanobacter sp. DHG33]